MNTIVKSVLSVLLVIVIVIAVGTIISFVSFPLVRNVGRDIGLGYAFDIYSVILNILTVFVLIAILRIGFHEKIWSQIIPGNVFHWTRFGKWILISIALYLFFTIVKYLLCGGALRLNSHTDYLKLFLLPLMYLSVAIKEEFLFRGFALLRLKKSFKNKYWIIIVTAVLFSLYHVLRYSLPGLVLMFIWGVIYAYIVYETGAIEITIALHFIGDTFLSLFPAFFECHFPHKNLMELIDIVIISFFFILMKVYTDRKIVNKRMNDINY